MDVHEPTSPYDDSRLHRRRIVLMASLAITALAAWFLAWAAYRQSATNNQSARNTDSTTTVQSAREPTDINFVFTLNTQDFSYPDQSVATVRRVIEIHETYDIPLDVSLTNAQLDIFERLAPDVIEKLKSSDILSASYHIRPPAPYDNLENFDQIGLAEKPQAEQEAIITEYEQFDLDPETGAPTTTEGGYQHFRELLGYPPRTVGIATQREMHTAMNQAFADMGATFTIKHGTVSQLGDREGALYVRPESYDLKLFEQTSQSGSTIIEDAITGAKQADGAQSPYYIGVKMHDNDFFAEDSAWLTVYLDRANRDGQAPFDLSMSSSLLSESTQSAIWARYESVVKYIADHPEYQALNSKDLQNNL